MKLSTICYLESDKMTLLLYRNKKHGDMHEGKWVGIGRKFEDGETPEECINREFYEETGLRLINPAMRGIIVFPNFFKEEDWIMLVFKCTDYEGILTNTQEGTLEWVETDKIGSLSMWDGDRLFLKWMNEPNFFSAKITYSDKKLKSYSVEHYSF